MKTGGGELAGGARAFGARLWNMRSGGLRASSAHAGSPSVGVSVLQAHPAHACRRCARLWRAARSRQRFEWALQPELQGCRLEQRTANSEQRTAKGPRKKWRGRRPKGSPWGPASAKQLQRTAKSNLRIPPVQGELRTSQIM